MNKTFTANIGGMVFHVEEQAYEHLKKYLDSVSQRIKSTTEAKEVLQDIELRVAELFQERLASNRQVITQDDVQAIIVTLGQPEEFDSGISGEAASNIPAQPAGKYRKIYRDPDDEVLAGVCSGLAHRLGIDPLWMRLIFLGGFFIWGSSLLLYIVLALLLPKAETTAQKLEMKGQEVTLSNLQQAASTVQPEKKADVISRILTLTGRIIKLAFKIVLLLAFVVLVFVSLSILLALASAILAVLGVTGISIPIIFSGFVLSPLQIGGMLIALILLLGVPAFVILYFIIRKVLRIRQQSRWIPATAIILMIIGLIMALATAIHVAADFSASNQFRQAVPFQLSGNDTLYIALKENDNMETEEEDAGSTWTPFEWENAIISVYYDQVLISGQVELTVQKADGPHFGIIQINHARGQNKKQALENAQNILYILEQRDSILYLNRYFKLDSNTKFRGQRIRLILKVPEGKSIHLMEGCDEILTDTYNVNQMSETEMINHTWTMTAQGLECRTCDESDNESHSSH
jgi:phage shock protein PspC (stress-responsive transcriptional regulator)